MVEPGLDRTKRLAGELIHPPGVTDLAALGLKRPPAADERRAGRGLRGVARRRRRAVRSPLRRDSRASRRMASRSITSTWRRGSPRPSAVFRTSRRGSGARVTGVDLHHPDFAAVTVTRDGRETSSATRLLVAADGASFPDSRAGGHRPPSESGSPTWPGISCAGVRSRIPASPASSWAARRPYSPTRSAAAGCGSCSTCRPTGTESTRRTRTPRTAGRSPSRSGAR